MWSFYPSIFTSPISLPQYLFHYHWVLSTVSPSFTIRVNTCHQSHSFLLYLNASHSFTFLSSHLSFFCVYTCSPVILSPPLVSHHLAPPTCQTSPNFSLSRSSFHLATITSSFHLMCQTFILPFPQFSLGSIPFSLAGWHFFFLNSGTFNIS